MQIISTMALYNHKVPVVKKKTSHSVLVNHGKTFQNFSRTYKQNSRTFQDSKKKSRTFPGCGNPGLWSAGWLWSPGVTLICTRKQLQIAKPFVDIKSRRTLSYMWVAWSRDKVAWSRNYYFYRQNFMWHQFWLLECGNSPLPYKLIPS